MAVAFVLLFSEVRAQRAPTDQTTELATRFRFTAMVEPAGLNATFAAKGSNPIVLELPKVRDGFELALWSYFFRHTQPYFAGGARDPSIGFYNPIADFWLATFWESRNDSFLLTSAVLAPGHILSTDKKRASLELSREPPWYAAMKKQAWAEVLPGVGSDSVQGFHQRAGSRREFATLVSKVAQEDKVRSIFRDRLTFFLGSIGALAEQESLAAVYVTALNAVKRGEILEIHKLFDGPTDLPIPAIATFPRPFREHLEPVAYLSGKDGSLVLSSTTNGGRWFLATSFRAPAGRRASLYNAAFVDLMDGASARGGRQ